jgi:hypothetical protein
MIRISRKLPLTLPWMELTLGLTALALLVR